MVRMGEVIAETQRTQRLLLFSLFSLCALCPLWWILKEASVPAMLTLDGGGTATALSGQCPSISTFATELPGNLPRLSGPNPR